MRSIPAARSCENWTAPTSVANESAFLKMAFSVVSNTRSDSSLAYRSRCLRRHFCTLARFCIRRKAARLIFPSSSSFTPSTAAVASAQLISCPVAPHAQPMCDICNGGGNFTGASHVANKAFTDGKRGCDCIVSVVALLSVDDEVMKVVQRFIRRQWVRLTVSVSLILAP